MKSFLDKINSTTEDIFEFENSKIKISKDHFTKFDLLQTRKKLAFIDSGFQEISNSLFLVKVHISIWKDNKSEENYHSEFLVYFSKNIETHKLTDNDFTDFIIQKVNKNIAETTEFAAVEYIIPKLEAGDVIIRDGSLDNFSSYIKNDVLVVGLSKSSSISTENNLLLTDYLMKIGPDHKWYYKFHSDDKLQIFFCKFHEFSDFSFRLDIPNIKTLDIRKIIEILASNCIDPIFLGYPYGLIEADSYARVTNDDVEYYKLKLNVEFGFKITKNAHFILDNIKF